MAELRITRTSHRGHHDGLFSAAFCKLRGKMSYTSERVPISKEVGSVLLARFVLNSMRYDVDTMRSRNIDTSPDELSASRM